MADGDRTGSIHYVRVAPGLLTVQALDIDSLHAAALYENQLRTHFIAEDARQGETVMAHEIEHQGEPHPQSADEAPTLLTVEDVARRLAEIAHHQHDDEAAHSLEDQLHADVLRTIAAGAPDAEFLAAAALRSGTVNFARWTA
ncbi:hypothetical protein FHS39_002399 [Streptomyces olivoverticillatus]|uniref:Uncharacterized protein n=1 Tax=Streptomyces olivoverticillatus TaxID=66427 RepID=A0A7W7LPC3_9ACTN|nr:hypothetical protein [Streptomyces olivoverticillatus]MBB4893368.1 hypothetical protein [Streptomyces olivoverticillatus]